jgi:hypothetical protein
MANIYFQIVNQFKVKWEQRYPGRKFYARPFHFKQAKDLMAPVEGFEPLPVAEVISRIDVYLKNPFFEKCNHNFHKFIEHFDSFVPPRKVEQPRHPVRPVIYCSKCNYRHYEGTPCRCKPKSTDPAPIPSVHDIIEKIKQENRSTIA